MYYRSNNAVLSPSIGRDIDTLKMKTLFQYVMDELFEKSENPIMSGLRIKKTATGYNTDKYEQLEKVYSMAYSRINSLEKNYIEANSRLNEIETLHDDWNNNGANAFSKSLIQKCREILSQLVAEPFVCPTACGSIQFEYEKENGDYLEFEIYENRIEVYIDTTILGENEFCLTGVSATNKMKQMVVDFYG